MSHVVSVRAEVRDPVALSAACRRLDLPDPIRGTARLFEGELSGLLVSLPGWLYPAVVDVATGQIQFDHFEGRWGDPRHLDRLVQAYAVERATIEARKRGHVVTEQPLADGSIRLQIVETS